MAYQGHTPPPHNDDGKGMNCVSNTYFCKFATRYRKKMR